MSIEFLLVGDKGGATFMSISYNPISMTEEEIRWIGEQKANLIQIKENSEISDFEVKHLFDTFYLGIVELYKKYQTKHLKYMYELGFNYDGYSPARSVLFLNFYEEYVNLIQDGILNKPIVYYDVIEEKMQRIKEYEDGTKEIIK